MKIVFNVLISAVVLWILWLVCCNGPKQSPDEYTGQARNSMVDALSHMKTCQSYFSRPISVTHDRNSDMLYVSCLDDIDSQDHGLICRTDIYGEIIDTLAVEQLRQPKGCKTVAGCLYITDINRVIRYSLAADSIEWVYLPPKAMYLQDVESDPYGNIFVSDAHAGCIYRIRGDSVTLYCKDSLLNNVTGLCHNGSNLVAGAKNCIVGVDNNGRARILAHTPFSVYGIRYLDNGEYLASDFVGNVHHVSAAGSQVIYKKSADANSADFEFIPEQRLIYLPTYKKNSMVLFKLCDSL